MTNSDSTGAVKKAKVKLIRIDSLDETDAAAEQTFREKSCP